MLLALMDAVMFPGTLSLGQNLSLKSRSSSSAASFAISSAFELLALARVLSCEAEGTVSLAPPLVLVPVGGGTTSALASRRFCS